MFIAYGAVFRRTDNLLGLSCDDSGRAAPRERLIDYFIVDSRHSVDAILRLIRCDFVWYSMVSVVGCIEMASDKVTIIVYQLFHISTHNNMEISRFFTSCNVM